MLPPVAVPTEKQLDLPRGETRVEVPRCVQEPERERKFL